MNPRRREIFRPRKDDAGELSNRGRILLAIFRQKCRRTGSFYATQQELADYLHCARKQAGREIRKLVQATLVTSTHHGNGRFYTVVGLRPKTTTLPLKAAL